MYQNKRPRGESPVSIIGAGIAGAWQALLFAQALRVAGVAEAARGRELDLHQPDAAATADQIRLIAALAQDHAMHQGLRHIIGRGVGRDHRIVFVLSGLGDPRQRQRRHRHQPGEQE